MNDPILDKLHQLILDHEDQNWDSDHGGCSAARLEKELCTLLAEAQVQEMNRWVHIASDRAIFAIPIYERFGVTPKEEA